MHLLELLENPLISGQVLHYVDALSLASLQRTCHATKAMVDEHYAHAFRAVLAQYFNNVDGFLLTLQRVGGCVTGSQALKVIMNDCNASWEAKDLDLSVPCGCMSLIRAYLEKFELYTSADTDGWSTERLGYHQMLKRQRLKNVAQLRCPAGHKIDILESCTCNCIAPLCEFHSTAVVNALFPDRITCCFPSHTLRYRSIPNALYQRERDHRSVDKYTGRGWRPIPGWTAILEEEVLLANAWSIDVSSALRRGKCGTSETWLGGQILLVKANTLAKQLEPGSSGGDGSEVSRVIQ